MVPCVRQPALVERASVLSAVQSGASPREEDEEAPIQSPVFINYRFTGRWYTGLVVGRDFDGSLDVTLFPGKRGDDGWPGDDCPMAGALLPDLS